MIALRCITPFRFARELRDLRQVDVSYTARIVQSRLSRIEHGLTEPTAEERVRILDALAMTEGDLAALEAALRIPAVEALAARRRAVASPR